MFSVSIVILVTITIVATVVTVSHCYSNNKILYHNCLLSKANSISKLDNTNLINNILIDHQPISGSYLDNSCSSTTDSNSNFDGNTDSDGCSIDDNIPIIILHGLLGSARNFQSWSRLLHQKLEQKHDIICMDLRNHGRTFDHGPLPMDYSSMAMDVIHTLDYLNINSCHLIGHSMGGKVAAAIGLIAGSNSHSDNDNDSHSDSKSDSGNSNRDTSLKNSSRIKSITIMDISPITYSTTDFSAVSSAVHELVRISPTVYNSNSKDKVANIVANSFPDKSLRMFVQSNIVTDNINSKLRWSFHVDQLHSSISTIAGFDLHTSSVDPGNSDTDNSIGTTKQYKGPVLILKGSNSNFVRSSHLKEIAAMFPLYNFATVKDAGHWLHAEKPEESTDRVKHFLDQVKEFYRS